MSSPPPSKLGRLLHKRESPKLGERLSGWLNAFSTSTSDLSSYTTTSSHALLTAAKHGKGHLDKAVRYLLDSDATPDKSTDPIWILGVNHPGYNPSQSFDPNSIHWPTEFYIDFVSRLWLTYRSGFLPIRDTTLSQLPPPCSPPNLFPDTWSARHVPELQQQHQQHHPNYPSSSITKKWSWNLGGEKGWTSDAGWGCMLRTAQSLLANSLITVHLGREWRRPQYRPQPPSLDDYTTYIRIITWFLDTPSPFSPFSVHRLALAGKELGKDVGMWFGPAAAAGGIKTLVNAFPDAGLGVSVASDGLLFQSSVYAASWTPDTKDGKGWGDRPVLLLFGVRLGLDGVNPVYYETIKQLYTFPQSVGIAGGRPSSSYYFVGSQGDSLFYLDPHHARPTVPLREPTITSVASSSSASASSQPVPTPPRPSLPSREPIRDTEDTTSAREEPKKEKRFARKSHRSSTSSKQHSRVPTPSSPTSSTISSSSTRSSNSGVSPRRGSRSSSSVDDYEPTLGLSEINLASLPPHISHYIASYPSSEIKTFHCERVRKMPLSGLDPSMLIGFLVKDERDWIDWRRRVGELPRTIFSVQDEPPSWPSDSDDNMGLESISDPEEEPSTHSSDEDSLPPVPSKDEEEYDEEPVADEDGVIELDDERYYDTRSGSTSTSASGHTSSRSGGGRSDGDVDTEDSEEPVDPLTPGAGQTKFDLPEGDSYVLADDDIEDDWIDPISPPPPPPPPISTSHSRQSTTSSINSLNGKQKSKSRPSSSGSTKPGSTKSSSSTGASSTSTSSTRTKKPRQIPIPVPPVPRIPQSKKEHHQAQFAFPVSSDEITPFSTTAKMATGETLMADWSDGIPEGKRMHTARARDGGRTQSGGVRGILTED